MTRRHRVDGVIAALADPTRRGVVDLLRRRPRRAGDLAKAFDVSPPVMSRHLRLLQGAGLVAVERLEEDARVKLMRLRRESFVALRTWLDVVQGNGHPNRA